MVSSELLSIPIRQVAVLEKSLSEASVCLIEEKVQELRAKVGQPDPPTLNALQRKCLDTFHIISRGLFDGRLESQRTTVMEFLMRKTHILMRQSQLERALELWRRQQVSWHLKRGLRLNSQARTPVRDQRNVTAGQFKRFEYNHQKSFAQEVKGQVLCIAKDLPDCQG